MARTTTSAMQRQGTCLLTKLDPTLDNDPLAFLQGGGDMGQLIRSHDWRHSELGLPEQWPAALKFAISSVLNSGTAMHISWGENLLQFYNDAYTPVLTDAKHPAALGRSVRESYPEIWEFIWPLFDRVLNNGEAIAMENAALMMYRDGVLKESFFSFSYSPLKSLSGEICGVAAVCWETTEDVIIKRRERGLRLLTEQLAAATSLEEVRHAVRCHVMDNRGDLPFVLWYERDEVLKTLRLIKSCGISPEAPLVQALGAQDGRSKLGKALDFSVAVARLLSLPEPATDWLVDAPAAIEVECIAIEPLCYVNYLTPDAYLVFGVGPKRPIDGSNKNFHENICRAVERAVRRISAVELERRESVRQFDGVMRSLEAAHIGYWDLDLLTYTPKRTLLHDQIFGYDELVPDWSYERFLEHVLPQDREQTDRLFWAGLAAKAEWDIECRIIRRDGALRWIWIHGDVLTDDAGDAVRTLGTVIDITDRKNIEEAMRESEVEFRKLAEAMPQIVWITRADGWNIYFNQQWLDYTGLTLDASLGHGWHRPFHPDDRGQAVNAWQNATDTVGTYSIESRLRRADGVYRWWLIRGVPVQDASGHVIKWFGTCTDINDRKMGELEIIRVNQELRDSEIRVKRLNRVYAVLSQINALIVRKPRRNELFREACRVAIELGEFRFAWVGVVDRGVDMLTPIASAGPVADLLELAPREVFECQPGAVGRGAQVLRERTPQVMNDFGRGQQPVMKQDMEERGIHSFVVIPLVVHGEAIGVFALYAQEAGFFDDEEMRLLQELAGNISLAIENLEKQERIDYLAIYDPLTGLANRALFIDRVSQHMHSAASGGYQLALILIDLERFKNVNDSLGRPAGDALLKQVAEWLARRGGDPRLLARVGTNHYAAVVPQVRLGGDLARLIEQALAAMETHPFALDGAILRITAKVGVALFPDDAGSSETLFQNAEAALKHAKASGDRYLFHSSAMTDAVAGKLSLENQLRRALDNEEFVLHYQPKVDVASGKVSSAEALIRWNDPDNGLIPPGMFIPVLEETGLIHEVGRWAMRKAIEDYLRWCEAGLAGVPIAVNVSSLQLRSRGFVAEVAQVLAIDPRAASGLEVEITESMVMGNIDQAISSLQAVRALGVTVALDDFGTGFSSLSYLARLPVDTLKIDRSFINQMVTPKGLALVSTIVTLGHALGHKVVAEGVETEEQSRLLGLLGCDEIQGFYFGRPVPSGVFEATYLAASRL